MLSLIWTASLFLSSLALVIMLSLVAARVIVRRRDREQAERRRALVRLLLSGDLPGLGDLRGVPPDLMADIFADLVRLVRGEERDTLVAQAASLGIPAHLGRRLRSGSARERLVAARILGEFDDGESRLLLHQALGDANEDVRLAAALSLAESGDPAEVHGLVERLGLGTEETSMMAVTLFRTIAEQRPEEIKSLIDSPRTNVRARLAAIEALATTGDYSLVPLIARLALAAPDDAEELPRYFRALGTLAHPSGREAVIDGMGRSATGARATAAWAAGRIGLVDSIERLAALLDDPEWWVRYRAGEALVRLGPAGSEALRHTSGQGTARARDAAETILGEHGLPD